MEQKTKPPKTGLARLLEFAMMKKPLVWSSLVLSAMASVVPVVYDVFADENKGFAQQRPWLQKCGGVLAWECSPTKLACVAQ